LAVQGASCLPAEPTTRSGRATHVFTTAVVGRDHHPIPTASPTFVATIDCVATNALDYVLLS
jgi:hypothetical protein